MLFSASCQLLTRWPGFGCSSIGHARVGRPELWPAMSPYGLSCRKSLRSWSGLLKPNMNGLGYVMAHDFDNRTVFMVAAIIGGVVLLLGLVGALA
jgi:hypothetical protein